MGHRCYTSKIVSIPDLNFEIRCFCHFFSYIYFQGRFLYAFWLSEILMEIQSDLKRIHIYKDITEVYDECLTK